MTGDTSEQKVTGLRGGYRKGSSGVTPKPLQGRVPRGRPTSVQKMHWHCVRVVICSTGNSPRHSLQDSSGSRARSHVGRYRAVVMAAQSATREAQAVSRGRGRGLRGSETHLGPLRSLSQRSLTCVGGCNICVHLSTAKDLPWPRPSLCPSERHQGGTSHQPGSPRRVKPQQPGSLHYLGVQGTTVKPSRSFWNTSPHLESALMTMICEMPKTAFWILGSGAKMFFLFPFPASFSVSILCRRL